MNLDKQENTSQEFVVPDSLILVVDDDDSIRKGLVYLLKQQGFRTSEACNGLDGLSAVENERPDLILLDLMMPGMNGIDVCSRLKNSHATRLIPVVMITALNGQKEKIRAIDAGADDFLNKPINLPELKARVNSLLRMKHLNDSLNHSESVIATLANAIEAKDEYTVGHNVRVADYASRLAQKAGFSAKEQSVVKKAGILHDIGKIGVPDSILTKTGPLTDEEFAKITRHPVNGDKILKPLATMREIREAVLHHHERYDGKGYPSGLKGENIPLLARIIAIADSYDAMTSTRAYRKALGKETAITELQNMAGKMWDPQLVELFIEMIELETPELQLVER